MRQGDFPDLHAEFFELTDGLPDGTLHARLHAGLEISFGIPRRKPLTGFPVFYIIRDRRRERRGIQWIFPGNGLQDCGAIIGVPCHRADGVERRYSAINP